MSDTITPHADGGNADGGVGGSPTSESQPYIGNPSTVHLTASATQLRNLCAVISRPADSLSRTEVREKTPRVVRVEVTHFRQNDLLTQQLQAFPLIDVDSAGELIPPVLGEQARIAVVVNNAVETQIKAVISVIAGFVFRLDAIAQARSGQVPITQIDMATAAADTEAASLIEDRLRYGWRAAVEALLQSAEARHLRLDCRYTPDPFPIPTDITSRMRACRRIYNNDPGIRAMIDKAVTMAQSVSYRIAGEGTPESLRELVQADTTIMHLRKRLNHLFRDALILGNGYMAISASDGPPILNLDPSQVRILGSGQLSIERDGAWHALPSSTVHIRGVDQQRSPYGISVLEPFLSHVMRRDTLAEVASLARSIIDTTAAPPGFRDWSAGVIAQHERVERQVTAQVATLIPDFVTDLPDASPDLYFDGQEDA